MKKIFLLILIFPLFAKAQFLPNLRLGYFNPNDLNKPLDSMIYPGPYYTVENYKVGTDGSTFEISDRYDVETNNYFITKYTLINQVNTNATQYSTTYYYNNNNKLISRNYLQKQAIDTGFNIITIDSFYYSNNLLSSIIKGFTNNNKLGFSAYIYDENENLLEFKPINTVFDTGIVYGGYFTIDSFNLKNQPLIISEYQLSKNIKKESGINEYYYDSSDRLSLYERYSFIFPPTKIKTDSTVIFYSGTNKYPDSTISYSSYTKFSIQSKNVYSYSLDGKIKSITRYNFPQGEYVLAGKSVYTKSFPTAIKHVTENDFYYVIYPNPNNGKFKLNIGNINENLEITVFNMIGEQVFNKTIKSNDEIEFSTNLKPGLYFASIKNNNFNKTLKFIVE